jgi:hypothetical protein
MGWLAKLFGQHDTTQAPQAPAEPPDPFDRFSDLTTPEHRPVLEAFLTDLARHLDAGTMVARPNDGTIEAHGKLGSFPVRVLAEASNSSPELKLTLLLPHEYGNVPLQCNPAIDQTKERLDEWSDTMRIFFAKSIFIGGSLGSRDSASNRYVVEIFQDQARRFAVLPEATREHVMAVLSMETTFEIRKDEIRMWIRRKAKSTEVKQTALALLGLMVEVANAIPAVAGGVTAGSQVAVAATTGAVGPLVKCGYCSASFFLDRRAACCHCGAPFTERA